MSLTLILGFVLHTRARAQELLTVCLSLYFVLLGTFAITATVLPFVEPWLPGFVRRAKIQLGFMNRLPKPIKNFLFEADDVTEGGELDLGDLEITGSELICGLSSAAFCWWYHTSKHWVSNNGVCLFSLYSLANAAELPLILVLLTRPKPRSLFLLLLRAVIGLSFSVQGIEMLSLGSVQVGMILLSGLFFYDIFWVFFTPVMVTVAKSFDAPIKLLFIRSLSSDPAEAAKPQFSMLGLGDIVIPGIYLALLLRMDHKRGFGKSNYFGPVFASYCLGLVATLVVMNVFQVRIKLLGLQNARAHNICF